jgi:TolA-binding protein
MARLTKRQMKEDKFVTGLLKSQQYFNEHRNQILIAAGALLVVAIVIALVVMNARSAATEAENEYGSANVYIREFFDSFERDMNQDGIPDGDIDSSLVLLTNAKLELERLLNKYGGTRPAAFASFYLGSISFKMGDYGEAEEYFNRFLKKYDINPKFEAAARIGIAACRESLRDFETAGTMYMEIAQKYPDSPQRVEVLYKATVNLAKAGLKDQAKQAYDLLAELPQTGGRLQKAEQFLYEQQVLDPYSIDTN